MRPTAIVMSCVLVLAACSRTAPDTPAAAEPSATPAEVAPVATPPQDPEPTPPEFDPAPWSTARLAAVDVPAVYAQQWRKADNRASCALVAFSDLGEGAGAKPRAANFSGGWAVAYDRPGERSAFGIAGAGVLAGGDTYDGWPDAIAWADGSHANYGLEGGTGPGHLAYLEIAGQGCLYNVWSKLGDAHLVHLLESLRFVDAPPAP
jgi:hypothetical protein